jgi:hypothetical protein
LASREPGLSELDIVDGKTVQTNTGPERSAAMPSRRWIAICTPVLATEQPPSLRTKTHMLMRLQQATLRGGSVHGPTGLLPVLPSEGSAVPQGPAEPRHFGRPRRCLRRDIPWTPLAMAANEAFRQRRQPRSPGQQLRSSSQVPPPPNALPGARERPLTKSSCHLRIPQ